MTPAMLLALLPVRGWVAVGATAIVVGFAGYRIGVLIGESSGYNRGYEAGEQDEYRKWANYQSEALEKAQEALAAATVRYAAEVDRAQKLQQTVAVTRAQVAKLRREKEDAIKRYVSDRQCLSADAVRLLNDQPANPAGVSNDAAAAGTGTSGGTAARTAASDRDVAGWVIDAREQYANCAAQVNAWVRWYQGAVK